MASRSFGVAFTIGGTAVLGMTDLNIGGGDVNMIDVTAHNSVDGWKEYLGGLKDGGSLNISGNFIKADAGQVKLREELGETLAFVVTLPDATTCSGNAVVGPYDVTDPIDDKIGFTSSLKVTGPLVWV